MPSTASAALLLFVKAPQLGTVKTRLGKDIGFDCSCQLYRCFGLDIVQRLQTLDWPLLLFFAPKDGESLVRDWLGSHTFYPQVGENLGDRMKHAFQKGFELGFKQLMIFGSDSPDVPLDWIQQGMQALQNHKAVIGPSNDGGYYTLGFSQKSWSPEVFSGIQWSSTQVYPDTLKILDACQTPLEILPTWDDIDTLSDLQSLYQRNRSQNHLPHSMNYMQTKLSQHLLPD